MTVAVRQIVRECTDLRDRGRGLRAHSRELCDRARAVRDRRLLDTEALVRREVDEADSSRPWIDRLRRTEADLVAAIAECTTALAEVRREIGWRDDAGPSAVVH